MTYDEFKQRYRYDPTTDILGEGAFGKVFRATDTETGSTVAIKVAPVNMASESHSLKHEFETIGKVAPHLNIALYDECHRFSVEWAGWHDFAVLEYYPLGSLDKILKGKNPLSEAEKHDLALGILEGLRHLHNTGSQGVVHRDLKPRNVLIQKWRGKYVPKITDFGLSKFSDSISNSVISQSFKGGTLNYASPEQIKGEQIRHNTDLWSFGVILHEIMTGEVPYKIDDSSESTLRQVYERMNRQSLPPAYEKINEPYKSIIKKCLVVNTKERYRTADEVLRELQTVSQTNSPTPTLPPPPAPIAPPIPADDKTQIFDNDPFGGFSTPEAAPQPIVSDFKPKTTPYVPLTPSVASKNEEIPSPKNDLESGGYVKSAPKTKNLPLLIATGVVILGVATFSMIYFGSKKTSPIVADSTVYEQVLPTDTVYKIDVNAITLAADSVFNVPDYIEYARLVLILEQNKVTDNPHSKAPALEKLKKAASLWENDNSTEARMMLKYFAEAILMLNPKDPKGLELQKKSAPY